MYVGRVWLHYSEERIWQLTPRQFRAQLRVHEDITRMLHGNGGNTNPAEPAGFIDQIPGW